MNLPLDDQNVLPADYSPSSATPDREVMCAQILRLGDVIQQAGEVVVGGAVEGVCGPLSVWKRRVSTPLADLPSAKFLYRVK